MMPTERWYVDVNGEVQVIDRASLQELVRMGFVTGSSEVSTDGVTFRKASEALPPEIFQRPTEAAASANPTPLPRNREHSEPQSALQPAKMIDEDENWLHERFLPIFSPAATLFVLFVTGWYLWGFLSALIYVLVFVAVAWLWLVRGKIKPVGPPATPIPPTPRTMPAQPLAPAPRHDNLGAAIPAMPPPSSHMPAHMPGRMRSVSARGDGLGIWILLGIVLLILLAVAAYFEFR